MAIERLRQPVIAKVHGTATAAGLQLMASADLSYATAATRFATPGVNIGLFCHTPAVPLTRAVGKKHAMELLLTGDSIDAARAKTMGLINDFFATEEQLHAEVDRVVHHIAARSARTVAFGKRVVREQAGSDVGAAYERASRAMVENMRFADAAEGIGAFLSKRPPQWRHE